MDKILLELEYIKSQVDSIVGALRGDESDATKPGLFMRVDRLEQSKKAHNRVLWGIVCGVSTIAAATVAAYTVRML